MGIFSIDHRAALFTNEQKNVLRSPDLIDVTDYPFRHSLRRVVVREDGAVLARLVESNSTVGLGCDIDEGRGTSIAGEQVCQGQYQLTGQARLGVSCV